jgi:ElaB/YqjD/DUF883 family membrane-anchored ribosome-binding protein
MPNTTDVRKYRETVLEQGKSALEEARKPLFAAVGATELAYGQLRSQFKELPADTQARLKKLQDRAQDTAGSLDPAQISARVRKALEEYAAQARETYEALAVRGEKVVRKLRRDPHLTEAFAETQQFVERTEELVTGKPVTPAKAAARATSPSGSKAPARKMTAKS